MCHSLCFSLFFYVVLSSFKLTSPTLATPLGSVARGNPHPSARGRRSFTLSAAVSAAGLVRRQISIFKKRVAGASGIRRAFLFTSVKIIIVNVVNMKYEAILNRLDNNSGGI